MDNKNKKDNGKLPKNSQTIILLAIAVIFTLFILSVYSNMSNNDDRTITYTELLQMAENGDVEKVFVNESANRLEITLTKEATEKVYKSAASKSGLGESAGGQLYSASGIKQIVYYTGIPDDADMYNKLEKYGVNVDVDIPDTNSAILDFLLFYIFPILIFWVFLMFIMRKAGGGGGVMGVGKSNAKMYAQKETGVTFKDVAGQDEAKESLTEIVDFLHNPDRYARIGAKLPKGALLVGPPGTGKTLLAKAVAGEAHVPFFSLSGSDFVEMFVGVGASRVRDLFKQAQNNAPCIIFIDEIDAIGKSRDGSLGGNDEREQTLNQLLSEMDGFDSSKGVFILAATNRPEILDKALLRPGRFDRRIIVDRPDLKGRINILKVHSRNVSLDDTVDLEAIALATSGAVGSDLANMINEAAINAVKHGRQAISQADLFESVEVVLVGKEKKDRILSQEERRIVSYHEVGHALVSALQKDSEPVQKITIVPRTMGALGYVMNVPEEEKYLNTEKEIRAMLVQFLGGRAAEEIVFDTVTTGAANDIERATKLARAMVTQYGMSKEFGLMGLESVENQYLTGRTVLNCADVTAGTVDQVVKQILKDSYEQAKELLSHHRKALDEIAAFLIERESITGREFMDIFHKIENPEMEGEDHEGAQGSEAAAGCESIDNSKTEDSPEKESLLPDETAGTEDLSGKTDMTEKAEETTAWETPVKEEDTTL
ncbi:MAG: ATP-dependent zinc metalloprotease FtsH [Lachnospiraceae bacterium]|nr:ATP-dependent zinc metalloprotease FtsH [Lachnospiraceae bacterium]